MLSGSTGTGTYASQTEFVYAVAVVCLAWYAIVVLVCTIGVTQMYPDPPIWRHFSTVRPSAQPYSADTPHVTVIRPVKGLEPRLYDCLASTFCQDYPKDKLHVRFCISDPEDQSRPIIERLLHDFPSYDAQLFIEAEDDEIQSGRLELGPNPKIRNMNRAYRKTVGEIIWIIDCNIWVAQGVCGRMVAKLYGRDGGQKYKFVHQLPFTIDVAETATARETESLLDNSNNKIGVKVQIRSTNSASHATIADHEDRTAYAIGGGRLDEMFMASAHAKFYVAINTVAVAPCIMGKSTMFRKSHLDSLTDGAGISQFSENICEDHLIGDLLWKKQVPEERQGESLGKHAMCFGDVAIQPIANMSLGEYWSRRVRWLRVRKFTVTLATLVEPGTESFLCSAYGAFAVSTLPFFHNNLGLPKTWTTFGIFWLLSVSAWCMIDRQLYLKLHSGVSIEKQRNMPSFARGGTFRPLGQWLPAWIGREALALPIWLWAFWGGTSVQWRGRSFWVGMDMKVHEVGVATPNAVSYEASRASSKVRND